MRYWGTKLYNRWHDMKRRCLNPLYDPYDNWGGRGISICKEWLDFDTFKEWAETNGYEEHLTLDRIDNDGDYCPDNCRWITVKEQSRNRRTNKLLTAFGETKPLIEWIEDERCTVNYEAVQRRLERGWANERAITAKHYERQ